MFNPLRPKQNGRYFADNILKYTFSNEYICIFIEIFSEIYFQESSWQ